MILFFSSRICIHHFGFGQVDDMFPCLEVLQVLKHDESKLLSSDAVVASWLISPHYYDEQM